MFNSSFIQKEQDPLLYSLIYHYFKGNLEFCLEPQDVKEMNWNWQQRFLDATFNNDLMKQYPISSQFKKKFLKKIIQNLEPIQDIHDELYAQLCTTMEASSENGFYYKHYVVGKCLNNIITIKETRNMVVNGTTGLKTWEAALVLSDWALCNEKIFSGKSVLELGSGVGFAGITIGKMCNVKSLFLTDCHSEVLKTINENVIINFSHFQKEHSHNITLYKNETKSIGVMLLDWNDIASLEVPIQPDIIIGADIVYDPTILQSLCNVIQRFFVNKNLEVYITSFIRNEETFSDFIKCIDTMNFYWEIIEMNKSVHIDWDEKMNKCILKITDKLLR